MGLRKRKFLSHKRSRSKSTSPISLCGKSTPKNKNSSSKTSSHKTTPYKKESSLSLIENYSLDVNGLMKVPCSQCQVDITKNPKIVIPNNNTSSGSGNGQYNEITNKEGGNNSSSNSNRKSNPLQNPYFSIICLNCLVNTFKQKKKNDFASMYYYIIDNLDFPFFTEDWSLQDDLKLLTNIEKLGLDNWEDIAKQMGNKGKVECESHYYTFYYKNKNDKLPNRNDVIIKKVAHNDEYYYEYDDKQGKLNKNKEFKNSLDGLLPKTLIPLIINRSNILPYKKNNVITQKERLGLVNTLKNLTFSLASLRDYTEAVITSGGVSVKDVNPSTMESKHIKNLYFIGEVLDVDAFTGGFNLQIAFSTAKRCAE